MKKTFYILFISLFIFSCDSDSNPVGLQCESFGLIEQDGLCVDDCGVVNGDNSTCTDNQTEIDVDWVLIKSPNIMTYDSDLNGNGGFIDTLGYYFVYTNSSLIDFSNNSRPNIDLFNFPIFEMECLDFEDLREIYISFIYNDEEFSYDISDVYIDEDLSNSLTGWYTNVDRIVYNPEMSYFMVFIGSTSNIINSSSPNELIDYR